MAILNSWQRIDRVLAGRPFGDGRDGAYTSTSIPTITYQSCSGSATSTTLTIASAGFTNGDVVLIHQTRGTGAGQWEVNRISSGGGSTSLTLQTALYYTFTDSGASQAQVIKIPMYSSISVASGTWTVSAWDFNVGGFLPIACNGIASFANAVVLSGKGYIGGVGRGVDASTVGYQGEGISGAGSISITANGSGGGGASRSGGSGGAGGGGHATSGGDGYPLASTTNGYGGSSSGAADGTSMTMGGAGGGSAYENGSYIYNGGAGGGGAILFAKNITITGTLASNGVTPGGTTSVALMGAGGGAGGGVLICCETAILGTNLVTALAGSGGAGEGGIKGGGAGSVGRIAVHHSGTVTGTTSPTFENVSDASLIEIIGGHYYMST